MFYVYYFLNNSETNYENHNIYEVMNSIIQYFFKLFTGQVLTQMLIYVVPSTKELIAIFQQF